MSQPAPEEMSARRQREERDALRAERDYYEEELARLRSSFSLELASRVERAGGDVRAEVEKQVNALASRWKWLLGLLTAAAGLGGLASIPGWIDGKVSSAVDAKVTSAVETAVREHQRQVDAAMEKAKVKLEATLEITQENVARMRTELREESDTAVEEFKRQAAVALDDVGKHALRTKEEITERARLVVVTDAASGTTVVQAASEKVTWFGNVPANVLAIGGSKLNQFASEVPGAGREPLGHFTANLLKALRAQESDVNSDGIISWREALDAAGRGMRKDKIEQDPVLEGRLADLPAFHLRSGVANKKGTLRAILVGCSKYANQDFPPLTGPENDARAWKKLLEAADKAQQLPRINLATPKLLPNEQGTQAALQAAITATIAEAKADDVILFFFSGHVAEIPEVKTKQLIAYDVKDLSGGEFLRADEIVKAFGKSAATVVVIIDG